MASNDSNEQPNKIVNQIGRKKRDLEQYAIDAAYADEGDATWSNKKDPNASYATAVVARSTLQRRSEDLRLDDRVGNRSVVNVGGERKDQAGFYCDKCDYVAADSNAWLDHLNSRRHVLNAGMKMRVMKSDRMAVQDKLLQLKQRQIEERAQKNGAKKQAKIAKRLLELEKTVNAGGTTKKRKNNKGAVVAPAEIPLDDEAARMAQIMGFSSFGGKNQKHKQRHNDKF